MDGGCGGFGGTGGIDVEDIFRMFGGAGGGIIEINLKRKGLLIIILISL
jgi:hypothetical protein